MGVSSHMTFFNDDMSPPVSNRVSVSCPDVAIPNLTGADRCQMKFTCLHDPVAMGERPDPRRYRANRENFANTLIDRFELLTGAAIRNHIEEIEIVTPVTYVRYPDMPKGNIYGYEVTPVDGIIPRIDAAVMEQYVPGLDFVSGYERNGYSFSSSVINGHDVALGTIEKLERGRI
jgi:prolycopene isomerase